MERKIGEIFDTGNGVHVKVTKTNESRKCQRCYYYDWYGCGLMMPDCDKQYRKDRTSIFFKEIKRYIQKAQR